MIQKQFNSEKKEKGERIGILDTSHIGILDTSHIRSFTICRLCIYIYYINYFIFIIYYHDGWFIGL